MIQKQTTMINRLVFAILPVIVIFLRLHTAAATAADVVFIIPDRSTSYPNGLHNGILASVSRTNVTVDVRDFGPFDPAKSSAVLQAAIDAPAEDQPRVYCIWPADVESRHLVGKLHEAHGVPIIQINQLPGEDSQWEWDHLLGYAGPDDALRARNAGVMMVEAMRRRGIEKPKVVALGYPFSYGGYHLSIAAFREAIAAIPDIEVVRDLALDGGSQNAYNVMVGLMDAGEEMHAVYAMDDAILNGAYEALSDRGRLEGDEKVTLVGTGCNGARDLLDTGAQYSTTIQSPFLEAALAIEQAVEYMNTGKLEEKIRFTPSPIATGETWESMVVTFLGNNYVADDICTWSLYHEHTNGLVEASDAQNACDYIECLYMPDAVFIAGFIMVGITYFVALVSFILLYIYRNTKVIKLAQPFFLALVLFGSCVVTTSIIFMSRDNQTSTKEELDASCIAWPSLLFLGQTLTTATLVAKIYRIKKITGAGSKSGSMIRRAKVTVKDVSGFIIVGLLADIVVLGVWFKTTPFEWTITAVRRDSNEVIRQGRGQCSITSGYSDSEGSHAWAYPLTLVLLHLALLVYAKVLAFQTRGFHEMSDSKKVAVSLFNSIQLLILAVGMVLMADDNVTLKYLILVCYIFLNNFGIIALVVFPKLYLCVTGRGDVIKIQSLSVNTSTPWSNNIAGGIGGDSLGSGDHSSNTNKSTKVTSDFVVTTFGNIANSVTAISIMSGSIKDLNNCYDEEVRVI